MSGYYGPPQHRAPMGRRPSDLRLQHYGPAVGPPTNVGGRANFGGRGFSPGGRFNGRGPATGRFNDRGRGHGGAGSTFAGRGVRDAGRLFPARGRGPPPPPPPPPPQGRGFSGRGMTPGRGMPGRGPMGLLMPAHPQGRGVPPPPPIRAPVRILPPPPPGRGPLRHPGPPVHQYSHPQSRGPPVHSGMSAPHAPPHSHSQHPMPRGAPPLRQHPEPYVHGHPHAAHSATNNGHPPHHSKPAPNVSAYTKEQIDQAWTEHFAPDSTKYYFNSISQESTYTKPECFTERQNNKIEVESAKQTASAWAEYTDPSTGKKYYSDGVTTTWERPADMRGEVDSEEEVQAPKKKKRKKTTEKETPEFNNRAEATAAFKGLLLAKGVQPTTKWNEVVKMCSSDSRWEACEVLSLGERKQALAEYQTKRANELRKLERQERMRAKEAFVQLLTEKLPTVAEFSAANSHFSDVRDFLAKDDRFYAVETEETREALFLDFCEEVRKREERKKRSKKREAKDDFLAFLKEREEEGSLTFASTWYVILVLISVAAKIFSHLVVAFTPFRQSFVGTLEESQRSDPRFQASPSLPDSERELCFADYVLELQAAEEERRRRIRDARRRAEKAQKEAFTEALRKMASEGSLVPSSRWRNVEELVAADPSFAPVQAHERDSPREIFEDFIEEWNDVYRRDRSFLSNLIQPSAKEGLIVTAEMTYEKFSRALLDQAAHSPDLYSETRGILNREDPISSARLYFNEFVSKAKESQSKLLKRSKSGLRRAPEDSSSEDEGEIREGGEVSGDDAEATNKDASEE